MEKSLIQGLKLKDRDAQTAAYKLYRTPWYMICLRYCSHKDDALDVLQNALIKIFSKIDQFDELRGSFKSWSSQIVVNENLQFLREKRQSIQLEEEAMQEAFIYEDEDTNILSSEELTKLIQQLPDGYRTVFNMYVMEGYTHNEIAAYLDIGVGTSKSQLSKARKMLQKSIEVLV